MTTTLTLASDMPQQAVFGTCLATMILPSFVGSVTHYKLGQLLQPCCFWRGGPRSGFAFLHAFSGLLSKLGLMTMYRSGLSVVLAIQATFACVRFPFCWPAQ